MKEEDFLVSIDREDRMLVEALVASGQFENEKLVLKAALASLVRAQEVNDPPESSSESETTGWLGFGEPELGLYVVESGETLRDRLASSAASGESSRNVLEIMDSVKKKLRANGTL